MKWIISISNCIYSMALAYFILLGFLRSPKVELFCGDDIVFAK
jgi:hypothetical protein